VFLLSTILVTNPNHGSKGLGIIGELPITTL
jgi:hypothetical protein